MVRRHFNWTHRTYVSSSSVCETCSRWQPDLQCSLLERLLWHRSEAFDFLLGGVKMRRRTAAVVVSICTWQGWKCWQTESKCWDKRRQIFLPPGLCHCRWRRCFRRVTQFYRLVLITEDPSATFKEALSLLVQSLACTGSSLQIHLIWLQAQSPRKR